MQCEQRSERKYREHMFKKCPTSGLN